MYSNTDTTNVEPKVHMPCAESVDPIREQERKLMADPTFIKRNKLATQPAEHTPERSERLEPRIAASSVE
jgi:hypothetical protein